MKTNPIVLIGLTVSAVMVAQRAPDPARDQRPAGGHLAPLRAHHSRLRILPGNVELACGSLEENCRMIADSVAFCASRVSEIDPEK